MIEQNRQFIGRRNEIELLRGLLDSGESQIAVVYGRRRVGKTALVLEAYSDRYLLSFEGLENAPKQKQISNFLFQLEQQTGKSIKNKSSVKTWSEALLKLLPIVKQQSLVVLLDEFQWTANYRSELVSELKMIWENYLTKHKAITLVLCGSIASFMITKVLKSKALYGRTNCVIHLKPFLLGETALFFPKRGIEEIILAQLLFGGVPKYLQLLKEQESVIQGITRLAFSRNGYFVDEYEKIFVSHFGTKSKYEGIILHLSANPYGLNREKISSLTGVEAGGELSRMLYNLESAGFITSFVPFDKPANSKLKQYVLTDPYLRLFFSFIRGSSEKHRNFINHILPSPKFRGLLARNFELLCLDHKEVLAKILGFSGIEYSAGPFFRSPKKAQTKGMQIDLVFNRADKIITLCEIKYQEKAVGIEVVREVQQKISKLPGFEKRTIQKVLISKSDASKEVKNSGFFTSIIRAEKLIAASVES